ncbi:hypothetical protein ACFUC2_05175 [[Kitasatospora] papulosa]|uniref:hypothetical protein n=1 Tax=Streptomyces TaxID=1883 RepID=UPI0033180DF9
MSSGTQELRILEEDHGADAITFENLEEGVTYLFVRPGQSFENAVMKILKALPELSLSRVQDLVRTHCPNVVEMNERLGVDQAVPRFEAAPDAGVVPPVPMKETGQHRRPRPPRWAKVAAVAAPALAGGMLLAHWISPSAKTGAPPITSANPSISQDDKVAAGTYRSPTFEKIADGGEMKCDPAGAYEAKCVDADGKVMYSEASVGTSTAFTFSYDLEKIGFRLFSDKDSAEAWASEEANQNLYQNVRQYGRVVLWGTDAERLTEWGSSLTAHAHQKQADFDTLSAHMEPPTPSAEPLPDRLAFLAFGTLGVTTESIHQAVSRDDTESVQLLRAVDLVLGNADGSSFGIIPAGPSDAVAVVANATSPAEDQTAPQGGSGAVPVDPAPRPPAPSTGTETTTPTAPAPGPVVTPTPAPAPVPAPSTQEPATEPKPTVVEPERAPEPRPQPPVVQPEPEVPDVEEPPVQPAPAPEPAVDPVPPWAEVPPVETPAPPLAEGPEDDGLAMDALPMQWAA